MTDGTSEIAFAGDSPSSWPAAFAAASEAWQWRVHPNSRPLVDSEDWDRLFDTMRAAQEAAEQAGRWRREPLDLLTICGVHRRELSHSAALAWLCDPEADHGLGDRLLRRLLHLAGGEVEMTASVAVTTEVVCSRSRADVAVESDSWTLVLEVKIDAPESDRQCQRLFEDWQDAPEARFLFITPTGRPPRTANTPEAIAAWRCASWRKVLEALSSAIDESDGTVTTAVSQYRQTLHRLYGKRHQ
ncbi:PD-(D/E)XK nuclease family protein [Micromonospora sp. NPDC004540]|uniref:PD-(D/E)XK nuclease family protein n=1 Tax=Micromonospora sp. NPDC004540 TaxID=3154457 RepID=UPI0033A8154F